MKVDIYWIPQTRYGRLAIMPRPRGHDWLEDEIKAWQKSGVNVIVSLLEPFEVIELGIEEEATICHNRHIQFISFPIRDRGVPTSLQGTVKLVHELDTLLQKGQQVAIHCRMGVGRSALIAACVLLKQGAPLEQVFSWIQAARRVEVPDTAQQINWVQELSSQLRK